MSELLTDMGNVGMLGSLEEDNKKTFQDVSKLHESDAKKIQESARVIDPTRILEEVKSIDPKLVAEFLQRNGINEMGVDLDLSKIANEPEKPKPETERE